MNHLKTLYNLWFHPPTGCTHAEKLENFYAAQVDNYDSFRKYLLWAREDMLKACSLRLEGKTGLIWVDLGGGTGENIEMMEKYMDLSKFSKIYIVDLCHSMCEKAKERVKNKKWENVFVLETDAAVNLVNKADLVTCSYSLSMMPNYLKVIDSIKTYLQEDGILGVCDFGVKHKYEMSWFRRFFWRSIFDIDNIDLGPERRDYLKHQFQTHWEFEGEGSIPYVPYLRAPYYIWIGSLSEPPIHVVYKNHGVKINHPSFLYHMSWEDPKEDAKYMNWNTEDYVLSLTGGGCNIFELLLHDVLQITTVDINKAQTALMELKMVAFLLLPYETVWKLFGEGIYEDIEKLYHNLLKYYLSNDSNQFWGTHLYYFKDGLYNHGGMGNLGKYVRKYIVKKDIVQKLIQSASLKEQYNTWLTIPAVSCFIKDRFFIKSMITSIMSNPYLCWFWLGVPKNQLNMLDSSIYEYLFRTLDPLMKHQFLKENYFYYNILTGRFDKSCCPDYLKESNFKIIKERLSRITLVNNTFLDELTSTRYTKIILMDHVDWMDETYAKKLSRELYACSDKGALIQWRSASIKPFYKDILLDASAFTEHVHLIRTIDNPIMDDVNMYAHYSVISKNRV